MAVSVEEKAKDLTPEQIRELAEKEYPFLEKEEGFEKFAETQNRIRLYQREAFIAGASLNTSGGLRWVKALERLPNKRHNCFVKMKTPDEGRAYPSYVYNTTCLFDGEKFVDDINEVKLKYGETVIEWLDDVTDTNVGHMAQKADSQLDESGQSGEGDGWISVEDGLPGEGERVFIYYKNDYGKFWRDVATYTNGGKISFDDEDDNWPECYDEKAGCHFLPKGFWVISGDEEKTYPRYNVIHWQPLPNPPIKSSGEQKQKNTYGKNL